MIESITPITLHIYLQSTHMRMLLGVYERGPRVWLLFLLLITTMNISRPVYK